MEVDAFFNSIHMAHHIFYRGNLVNVLLYIPTQIANYVFSDIIQKVTPKYNREKDGYVKWLLGNMAAGALGAMTSLVYFPLTYAQTRLVTDIKPENAGGEYQFNNLFDVFRKTWASDGIGGHYRGFLESILGIVVYRGCYFAFYDFLKPLVLTGSSKDSFAATFLLGWGTTVAAGLVSYPFGTIQRRMMMTSCEPDKNKYSSFWHCASFIWENEGVSSFFKGAGLHIIRGVCGALVTTGMNSIHYYMMKRSS